VNEEIEIGMREGVGLGGNRRKSRWRRKREERGE
jgi:hypothetical protein